MTFLGYCFQMWIKSIFWCVNDGGRATHTQNCVCQCQSNNLVSVFYCDLLREENPQTLKVWFLGFGMVS